MADESLTGEASDEPWGLSALDDDTLASVMAAVAGRPASDIAAMAMTCTAMAAALQSGLRSRKSRQLDALTLRLGWSEEMLADAQILHSTGQRIDDAELLLLCALLFDGKVKLACERPAPHLNHLNLGSNRIGDRGVVALVAAATRAPRERLEALMLSRNEIGDEGAFELARAIEARVAFPNLRLVSIGGNALSAAGEAAVREVCEASAVSVFGVGALRGAPLAERFKQASWLEGDGPAAATRSNVSEQEFARGVRERAVARRDPFISSESGYTISSHK